MPKHQRGYTGFNIEMSASILVGEGGLDVDRLGEHRRVTELSYPKVCEVRPDTPAAAAGLMVGDVIFEVNGFDSRYGPGLYPMVGVPQVMRIRRGDEEREITLVPVARPEKGTEQPSG